MYNYVCIQFKVISPFFLDVKKKTDKYVMPGTHRVKFLFRFSFQKQFKLSRFCWKNLSLCFCFLLSLRYCFFFFKLNCYEHNTYYIINNNNSKNSGFSLINNKSHSLVDIFKNI